MPSPVRDVTVTNLLAGRRMLVEWTLNSQTEVVTVYEVYRSTTEYQGFEKIGEVQSPTYQFMDKVPYTFGIVFFYKVLAKDNTGLRSDISESNAVQDSTFDDFEERPFRATTVSFGSMITGEVPAGAVNGTNQTFTTANLFRFNTVQVLINGLASLRNSSFTEGTDQRTITLTPAPDAGSQVQVNYLKV